MRRSPQAYVAVYRRGSADGWPYDLGDDPAFEASETLGGRITWGVCRPDLRNRLKPGDLVIFISVDATLPARYVFVGYATVDRVISRDAIWQDPSLSIYQTYRNLLVRRVPNGFVHDEPRHFGRRIWHPDWLARIIEPGQRGLPELKELQRRKFLADGTTISGESLRMGANYVIFRQRGSDTEVMADPPTIALATAEAEHERWVNQPFAAAVRDVIFARGRRDYLRTASFRPHPYIRIGPCADTCCTRIRNLMLSEQDSVGGPTLQV